MAIPVKPSQAKSIIAKLIRAKLVTMLHGSPGTGKSSIVREVADTYNLLLLDKRLAQEEPTDLKGFPAIVNGRATYIPFDDLPLEGDPIPEGYAGWLLFLDEANSAPPAVQAAAYKLTLDRMVGQKRLHKCVAIVLAGNKETDGAIVEPMSTALQSRLVHLELVSDHKEWTDWAATHDIDQRITSYIEFKPSQLYAFKADHTDYTYACNRTWEFADRILKVTEDDDPDRLPMLSGCLSEGVAREFLSFLKVYREIPKVSAILAAPESTLVPGEPSYLYALTGSLSEYATVETIGPMLKYIDRMPREFQVICIRQATRRTKSLMAAPEMRQWLQKSSLELFN